MLALAARARSGTSAAPGHLVFSRVLARSGRWIVLHGASLVSGGTQRAAVILEPAHPARIAPLLMDAYGLTEREQEVTSHGLVGGIGEHEGSWRMAYVRGPEGIIVALR